MATEYLKCGQCNQEMESLILVKYLYSHLWLVVTVLDSLILDGWASEEIDFEEAESTVCWTLVGWGHYLQAVWEPGQGLGMGQLCSRALADPPGLISGFFLVLSWAEKRGKLTILEIQNPVDLASLSPLFYAEWPLRAPRKARGVYTPSSFAVPRESRPQHPRKQGETSFLFGWLLLNKGSTWSNVAFEEVKLAS